MSEFIAFEEPILVGCGPDSQGRNIRTYTEADLRALTARQQAEIGENVPGISDKHVAKAVFTWELYNAENSALALGITSQTMAKALQNVYKGKQDPTNSEHRPIAVQGMVVSRDDCLVVGVRSKPAKRTRDEPMDYKVMLAPAGYASFSSTAANSDNPLEVLLWEELHQELGLRGYELEDLDLMGYHHDTGWTEGVRMTWLARARQSFAEIVDSWRKAEDGWEYTHLLSIPHTRQSLGHFLHTTDFNLYERAEHPDPKANTQGKFEVRGLLEQSIRPPLEWYVEKGI